METELNDTIEWLSKRVFIGKRDEEYIRFAIKEYASKYHESELKKLRVTDVMSSQKQVEPEIQRALDNFLKAQVGKEPKKKRVTDVSESVCDCMKNLYTEGISVKCSKCGTTINIQEQTVH